MNPHLRALLATSRIANVPSVMCSVWLMMLIFGYYPENERADKYYVICLAAAFLYIAGNFLNDWMDFVWDKEHRPERAIPSGLFSRITYLLIAIALFLSAYFLLWLEGSMEIAVAAMITILVVIYTLIHKKTPLAIWVMGSCRACLYLLGYIAVSYNRWDIYSIVDEIDRNMIIFLLWPMLGMCCYIAGISLLARYESRKELEGKTKLIAVLLLFFPIFTHTCGAMLSIIAKDLPFTSLLGVIPFALWTWHAVARKNISVSTRVSLLLAGIALVDGILYVVNLESLKGYEPHDLFLPGMPFIAFFLALLLQKIAPAT
jgi:4-hydroxybenzoate polyprenyltransferase